MKKNNWFLAAVALFAVGTAHAATVTTIYVTPDMVPDEETPLVYGGAPSGFGSDSWQNTNDLGGKVNWHARYLANGDFLSALFPTVNVATLTVGDIASISYSTLRPIGTNANEDWSLYVYTRNYAGDSSPGSGWYGDRFINNFGSHGAADGMWNNYSTDSGMTFSRNSGTTVNYTNFTDFRTANSSQLIEMISIQTHSNFADFNGAMDGLVITLTSGDIGRVDFGAVVPVPAAAPLGLLGMGLVAFVRRRKNAKA